METIADQTSAACGLFFDDFGYDGLDATASCRGRRPPPWADRETGTGMTGRTLTKRFEAL
ncbi:hypothetical protein [Nocardiopsis synnemataformans]|uniref:hypothetical protein n=1 Tax=Nocardiopsis synnemataformans TaxID=61305 RepID=UPI003EBCD124